MSRRAKYEADSSDKPQCCTPVKRLLAAVLQRAMTDMLSLYDREQVINEVKSGKFDADDREVSDKYGTQSIIGRPRAAKKLRDGRKEREARDLIRWFRSESTEEFSFIYILIALGMDDIKDEILWIMENDTIEDRPNIQRMI